MMKRATFVALALTSFAVLALATPGVSAVSRVSAQQTPQRPPVFRSATELVEIDVVVVDKAGQRVHGLTKDDFVLKDRKKPQLIETFTEVRREIERATELPPLPAETRVDVATNTSAKAGRLVVLVLDDLHVFRGRAETVKDIARKIVNDLGPESSMALIQTGGEHGVEVTDDRSRLLAAVDTFKGRRPTRRPLQVCNPVLNGRDLPLNATISALAPDGTVVITFDRPLSADRQSSLDISLPLAQLAPGAYRLQVVVSDGSMSDTREIGFVVK